MERLKSTTRCWSAFGGAANVDEVQFPEQGFSGLTVRLVDQSTGAWSIYWANSRDGILGVPVTGRFENGVGLFYADEVLDHRSSATVPLPQPRTDLGGAGVQPPWSGVFQHEGQPLGRVVGIERQNTPPPPFRIPEGFHHLD